MDVKKAADFISLEPVDLSVFFGGEDVSITLREPTTREFQALQDGATGNGGGDEVYLNNFLNLLPEIIVKHNLTAGSKPATAAAVAAILEKRLDVVTRLTEVFKDLVPLAPESPKK